MNNKSFETSLLPCLLLLSVALIWGCGFIVTNHAVHSGISPALLMTLRFLIPSIIMAFLFRRELAAALKSDIIYSAAAGFILFLAFVCQTYGIRYTTPANNAFLTSTNVIMVPFLSLLFFKQKPNLRTIVCAFACFAGAAVLSWSPGIGINFGFGDRLTLYCAFLFAVHYAYLGYFAPKISSAAVLCCVQLFSTAVFSFIFFMIKERSLFVPATLINGALPILYLAILSTGFCYFVQSWAQRKLSPSTTSIILSTEGVFGSLLSVMLGFDKPTITFVVGGTVIFISVMLVQIDFNDFKLLLLKRHGEKTI